MARRLSRRYIHPLASFLSLFTPARIGRAGGSGRPAPSSGGERRPECRLVRIGPLEDPVPGYIELIEEQLGLGLSSIVMVPEVREGSTVLSRLAQHFGVNAALVHSGINETERSKALWSVAAGDKPVILGGRNAVYAPPVALGRIILHDEHDRSYKDQRSPYVDARIASEERARANGSQLTLTSRTPSLTSLQKYKELGAFYEPLRGRERDQWPAVEVIETPRTGLPRRAIAAMIEARARRVRTLILLPRAKASRAGPGPAEVAAFVGRVLPGALITRADRPGLGDEPGALSAALAGDVVVATEAGLAEVQRPTVGLGIALGIDLYLQRPQAKASEEAFSALWSLGSLTAGKSPRGRLILETDNPHHYLVQALTRGDYGYFARWELAERFEANAPPFRTIIKLHCQGAPTEGLMSRLAALPGLSVLGSAEGSKLAEEILLKAEDLEPILDPLGTIVREASQRLLVELDPRDW